MTDGTQTAPRQVLITPAMERVINHMLENSRGEYYAAGIETALGISNVGRILNLMFDNGWVTHKEKPSPLGGRTRRYYRFTTGTAPMLRKVVNS